METMLYVFLAWLIGIAVGYILSRPAKPQTKTATNVKQMIPVGDVQELHAQLSEHFSDNMDPDEAVNKATDILAKILSVEQ